MVVNVLKIPSWKFFLATNEARCLKKDFFVLLHETRQGVSTNEAKKGSKMKNLLLLVLITALFVGCEKRSAEMQSVEDTTDSVDAGDNWEIKYYVDDFDDPTDEKYIRSEVIEGTFSNSATDNSLLYVQIVISDSTDIYIRLFEYGKLLVKGISTSTYKVLVRDSKGTDFKLKATNYSDRLEFNVIDSQIIHKLLQKGNKLKFYIEESGRYASSSTYRFNVESEGYDEIFKEFSK